MSKEEFNAYLGTGTSYQGQLTFQGTVRIDGEYTGEITSEGTLILGKDARVRGKIHVAQLILSGTIEGEILVGKKTVMHKTAHLHGNIITPTLAMEEGAILQGKVQMTQDPLPRDHMLTTSGMSDLLEPGAAN
ncbi:MAG: polymer-forming cytoskeletal protein [Deltaproteobacteria bacterium]|jgi:cytoskeletal protein CcmA (bactofilin family)|nr:polymer-forming cytoskeletal protein [Deltaproteobacteria bacterium]